MPKVRQHSDLCVYLHVGAEFLHHLLDGELLERVGPLAQVVRGHLVYQQHQRHGAAVQHLTAEQQRAGSADVGESGQQGERGGVPTSGHPVEQQ